MVNAVDFYHGHKDVDLAKDELICEILIPDRKYLKNYFYDKVSIRSSVAISNISIAAVWETEKNVIRHLAIGVGSATDVPVRCNDMEQTSRLLRFSFPSFSLSSVMSFPRAQVLCELGKFRIEVHVIFHKVTVFRNYLKAGAFTLEA